MKYLDLDGNWFISKNKKTNEYGIGTNSKGIYTINYGMKAISKFIPFGGYAINIGSASSKINPATEWAMLFNSDDTKLFSTADIIDGMSLKSSYKNLTKFKLFSFVYSSIGLKDVIDDFNNDLIIEKFMEKQEVDIFKGCQSDKDAIRLAKYLVAGALYYYENEERMKKLGISETIWGKRIRRSTNGIWGHPCFESFKELEKAKKLDW